MRARRAALHTLVGAYVLDAVTRQERADFERHVLTCEQCREDVSGLREAAAQLATAAAVSPRPALREQIVRTAGRTRQLPPVVDGEQPAPQPGWRNVDEPHAEPLVAQQPGRDDDPSRRHPPLDRTGSRRLHHYFLTSRSSGAPIP